MINLLWLVAVICVVLWFFGFVANFTMGGLVHALLVLAVAAIVVRLVAGRRMT